MARDKGPRPLNPPAFKIADWREIFDLYPSQWLAIAVDEITLGVGVTAGRIIARGKRDRPVLDKLIQYRASHPDHQVAFFYTGKMWRPWMDVL